MQDIHPTLTAAGNSLPHRRHHLHHQTPSSSSAAALKCPRCDSPNTKFCYYNNYNLSQPRHFCKSCRRYWTFGGVLRNVPVGGASRKSSKRPKPKPKPKGSLSSSSSADSATTHGNGAVLDAPTEIAGFTSLTKDPGPGPGPEQLGFLQMEGLGEAIVDPTVRVDDVVENRGNGGVVALDWEIADQNVLGLFDQDYWTQSTTSFQQWSDNTSNNNHDYLSLFLP